MIFSIHQTETPIFEMENYYKNYEKLKTMIEEKFPYQSEDENQKLFKSTLECMNYKGKVRTMQQLLYSFMNYKESG